MKAMLSGVVVVALLLGGLAFSQGTEKGKGGGNAEAQKQAEALQQELSGLKQKHDALAADLEETKALMAKTLAFLDAQAKSAAALAAALDEAEQQGFTAGINPQSRQTLLAGWRAQLAAAQQNVPAVPPKKADAPAGGAKKKPQ